MSLVAIVGRPNVGKSTLFNRLVGQRKAIVDAKAGTTRDRHYGKTDWNGREFSVIDTGGYTVNSEDIFEDEIRRQVLLAIDEADVILFLVEVKTGITDLDMLMADLLRRTSKKVILVCNKVDNNDQIYSSHEFYALGLGDPYCISSMSGSGTGDLMDAILAALPAEAVVEEEENLPHITIVGRPNVGKSSMTNALLGAGNYVGALDELYLFLTNLTAIEYIRNLMKRDRKKESLLVLASQNIEDFLQPGVKELTKPLFSIPVHQFLFNPGQLEPKSFCDTLQLEDAEFQLIRYPERGTCLYRCGNERYLLQVHFPEFKEAMFGKAGGR